jgi:predicted  nucleic acid-binding Zn-ribbon protein
LNQTVKGLQTKVSDNEGNSSKVSQTVKGLQTEVSDNTENISSVSQTVTGLQTKVSNNEGSISTLNQTVTGLQAEVSDNTGSISTLSQTVNGLQTKVSDNTGNISKVNQTVKGLQTDVSDNAGNISTLNQTVKGLQSKVSDNERNISTVTQTANGLKVDIHGEDGKSGIAATVKGLQTDVSDNERNISTVTQTVKGLETTVSGNNGLTTIIRQDSNGVTVGKKDANGNYTTSRSVVGSDGTFKVIDKSGRTLASYGSDIRLLPEPASGTSTSKIYIAGDSVHNAGVIRGDFNTGEEDGRLSISSTKWLTLSGYTGVTVKAEANSEPFIEVYGTGVRTKGVLGINNTHTIGGVWFGSDVIYMDGAAKLFMTQQRFIEITGSVSGNNFVMFATNGDWNAANLGVSFAFQYGGVVLHTSGWTVATHVRVNWMIVKIGA